MIHDHISLVSALRNVSSIQMSDALTPWVHNGAA